MIDYEKLKKAHELADSSEIYYFSAEFGVMASSFKIYDSEVIVFVTHCIDDLITKLEKLVKPEPEPKYKVGDRVFVEKGKGIYSFKIDKILYDYGYWYLNMLTDSDFDQYREDVLFSSKEALIEAQLQYWQKLYNEGRCKHGLQTPECTLCKDEVGVCQHEPCSEPYLSCPPWIKCRKCGEFYK